MKRKIDFLRAGFAALVCLLLALMPAAVTAQSTSPNYQVNEFFFGSGGELEACSLGYCARLSAGETGVGSLESANFAAFAGFNTTDQPYIEFEVTTTSIDLGVLDASSAKTGTGAFTVRTYLASGYVVTVMGSTLTGQGGATINALASQTASSTGTEQFGMNLVANTAPATFGADPVQYPDATFSFGEVNGNYDNANQYRFVSGDQVAFSNSSSGITNYTVSYIANIAPLTDAGLYTTDHVYIATGTY